MKNFLVFVLALVFLVSCNDENPVKPVQTNQNLIYFFTDFTNPDTQQEEYYFCRMNEDGTNRVRLASLQNSTTAQYSATMERLLVGDLQTGYEIMDSSGQNRKYLPVIDGSVNSFRRLSPDGNRIFKYDYGDFYIFNSDGSGERFLLRDGGASDAYWSNDSRRIIYKNYQGIISLNADDSSDKKILYTNIIYDPVQAYGPRPLAVNDKIFFYRSKADSSYEWCLMNGDGTNIKVILTQMRGAGSFIMEACSPDGNSLLLRRGVEQPGKTVLYILNLEDSSFRQITYEPHRMRSPARFSPDGQKILYDYYIVSSDTIRSLIKTIDIDGKNEKVLTPNGYSDHTYIWAKR